MAVVVVMVRVMVMGSVPIGVMVMVMSMPRSQLCAHRQAKLAEVAVHQGLALESFLLQLLQAVQHRVHKAQFRQHQPVDLGVLASPFLHRRLDFFSPAPL
jgi:hypothetical protein